MKALTLGTIICRFTVPQTVIDEINNDYDNGSTGYDWSSVYFAIYRCSYKPRSY